MNRDASDAVVAVNRVVIEMEIVERIALVQRQAVPRPVRLLGKQDVLKQVHSQAGFDSLMNRPGSWSDKIDFQSGR